MPETKPSQSYIEQLPPGCERYIRTEDDHGRHDPAAFKRWESYAKFIVEDLPWLSYLDVTHETEGFYRNFADHNPTPAEIAVLGLCDRYFLLTHILHRPDAFHPWLFERCREVEADPDDHLDLWAREHYKSTIITFAGCIQEILRDPEITIGIFSVARTVAKPFLNQIKEELRGNDDLKRLYADVLWLNPERQALKWSEDEGIIVRRKTNPKESTVEAWGLVDGMPTGRHFRLRVYDDVVTERSVGTPEQVQKTTAMRELSENLGSGMNARQWNIGTRYAFGDTYGVQLDRGSLKARLYPATDNGRKDGKPVFLTEKAWAKKLRDQPGQIASQQLQNPASGENSTFRLDWLRSWETRPRTVNIYILVDPSKGPNPAHRTDNTGMAVWAYDSNKNMFLVDGFRHRMNLGTRWKNLKYLHRKWRNMAGVLIVRVGYEQYGMQSDLEHFEHMMKEDHYRFDIQEVAWTRHGVTSKNDRVERLQPDHSNGRIYLPLTVWHEVHGIAGWRITKPVIDGEEQEEDQIEYYPLDKDTRAMTVARRAGLVQTIAKPIMRKNEDGQLYDVTRAYFEEYVHHPFGPSPDLLDAASRFYDMEPVPPVIVDPAIFDPETGYDT